MPQAFDKRQAQKPAPAAQPSGKARFLKILLYIGVVLLLLTPTYIAITHYIYQKNNAAPEIETYYTAVDITGPTGVELSASGDDTDNDFSLLVCFDQMLTDCISVPDKPSTHTGAYQITMHTNTTETQRFTFYFSPSSPTAYFTDAAGNCWQASEEYSKQFLNSTYAFEIYPQATPPVLTTAATDVIIPSRLTWSYRTQNENNFADLTHTATTDEILTYPIANDIAFYFSLEPSIYDVVIRRAGIVVHNGSAENISLGHLVQNEILDVEIHASYRSPETDHYHGEVTYQFRMRVVEAASFSPDTLTPLAGGYLLLTCHNVRNEQNLKITASPALSADPVIFRRGETVYAVIPAMTAGAQRLTVSYGTVSSAFDLTVGTATATDCTLSADDLRGNWQDALDGGIAALIGMHATTTDNGLPRTSPLITPTGEKKIGFGETITAFGKPSPLELYLTDGTVSALAFGKVLYEGNDALLGNFVILDHGGGLCTWYGGLLYTSVSVGDTVDVGQSIGVAGKSGIGLNNQSGFTILATLGKTAISPQYLREHTFNIS